MKKETVEAFLAIKDDQYIVIVNGEEEYPETVLAYLKKGVKLKKIKACTPRQGEKYTSYKFKIYDEGDNLNNYFVIKVKNSERYLYRPIIKEIREITEKSNLIKKVNRNRFIAGITASALFLTVAGPTIAKGIRNTVDREYDLYDDIYGKPASVTAQAPTEEDIAKYYEGVRIRAEQGDEEAMREYQQYLLEQQVKEQLDMDYSRTR